MRKKGSCRFEPYFKVQFYDSSNMAWKDIQKAVATEKEARELFIKGKKCRIMKVTEKGREVVA